MSNPYDPSNPSGHVSQPNNGAANGGDDGKTEVVRIPPTPGTPNPADSAAPPAAPPTTAGQTPPGYAPGAYGQTPQATPPQAQPPQGSQPSPYAPGGFGAAPGGFGAAPGPAGQQSNPGHYNATQIAPGAIPQQPAGAYGAGTAVQNPYGQPGAYPGQQSTPYGAAQPGQQYGQPGQQYGQPGQQYAQPGQYGQPGQYSQPGDQFAGMSPKPAKRGLWKALIAGGAALILIAVAIIVSGALWWWPKSLDQSAVEDGVSTILTEQYQADNVTDVSCPSGQKVKQGASFECSVKVGGQSQKVKVTFLDDKGKYEVARPTS